MKEPLIRAITRHWFSTVCLICATVVIVSGHDGWGWLLFFAFLAEC